MMRRLCSTDRLLIHTIMLFYVAVILAAPVVSATDKTSQGHDMGNMPVPGAVPLDENGEMRISSQDRCPVCAMLPAKSPKFACAIELKDGRTYYFCGTGCMIRSWMHPEVFLNSKKSELKRSVVREYMGGEFVDGRDVIWAAGSDVMGPMGPALIPLKSESDLAAFKKRHGAKATFRLDEMNDQLWEKITGKKALK